ncbi:hypothetical protein, partial [Lysinibacillus sp. 54212]|uniref:hypothetical protein n=1 Tax=Lysinibacillus sp. 54212 TaxID=3119829 RepID=UPI002FCBBF1F
FVDALRQWPLTLKHHTKGLFLFQVPENPYNRNAYLKISSIWIPTNSTNRVIKIIVKFYALNFQLEDL